MPDKMKVDTLLLGPILQEIEAWLLLLSLVGLLALQAACGAQPTEWPQKQRPLRTVQKLANGQETFYGSKKNDLKVLDAKCFVSWAKLAASTESNLFQAF